MGTTSEPKVAHASTLIAAIKAAGLKFVSTSESIYSRRGWIVRGETKYASGEVSRLSTLARPGCLSETEQFNANKEEFEKTREELVALVEELARRGFKCYPLTDTSRGHCPRITIVMGGGRVEGMTVSGVHAYIDAAWAQYAVGWNRLRINRYQSLVEDARIKLYEAQGNLQDAIDFAKEAVGEAVAHHLVVESLKIKDGV